MKKQNKMKNKIIILIDDVVLKNPKGINLLNGTKTITSSTGTYQCTGTGKTYFNPISVLLEQSSNQFNQLENEIKVEELVEKAKLFLEKGAWRRATSYLKRAEQIAMVYDPI